jgi:hypothetical protein
MYTEEYPDSDAGGDGVPRASFGDAAQEDHQYFSFHPFPFFLL